MFFFCGKLTHRICRKPRSVLFLNIEALTSEVNFPGEHPKITTDEGHKCEPLNRQLSTLAQ